MICDQTQQTIAQIVQEYETEEKAFTAFEVSLEAKRRGAQERHRDMRNDIHKAMEFSNYEQTMVLVGNENGQDLRAILYHPAGYDVDNYQPLSRDNSACVQRVPVIQASAGDSSVSDYPKLADNSEEEEDEGTNPDNVYELGSNGETLLIRKQYLQELGLNPWDTIFVHSTEIGKIKLSKEDPKSANTRKQTVHKRGYARLAKGTMHEFGLYAQKFQVSVDGESIEIQPA